MENDDPKRAGKNELENEPFKKGLSAGTNEDVSGDGCGDDTLRTVFDRLNVGTDEEFYGIWLAYDKNIDEIAGFSGLASETLTACLSVVKGRLPQDLLEKLEADHEQFQTIRRQTGDMPPGGLWPDRDKESDT